MNIVNFGLDYYADLAWFEKIDRFMGFFAGGIEEWNFGYDQAF